MASVDKQSEADCEMKNKQEMREKNLNWVCVVLRDWKVKWQSISGGDLKCLKMYKKVWNHKTLFD